MKASRKTRGGSARWIASSETVSIQGVQIAGGHFYLGAALSFEAGQIDKYVVNPDLSAKSSRPDIEGRSMPYWPSYAEVPPASRRAFLDWMSTGRCRKEYAIGYVFLFFYGLEHRLFVDRALEDASAIISEVERLLTVYGENQSFRGYATRFFDVARCAAAAPIAVPEASAERPGGNEIDTRIRLHLGRRLSQSRTILSDDALLWVLALPDIYLRTPAVRCFREFTALWDIRFRSRFPEGLTIATTGNIDIRYRAASGAFEVKVDGPHRHYPDIAKSTTSPEPLRQLVQECTEDLDGFSRLVGKKPEARDSLQAALLLPDDLLNAANSDALRIFGNRLSEMMGGQSRASSKMGDLLRLAGFGLPQGAKVPPAVADQLGRALDRLDVAIEPDRRYGAGVRQADDQVFLFKAAGGGPVDPDRPEYRTTKAQVEVAVLAAASDGEASSDEMHRVIAGIRDGRDLSGVERARLISFAVTVFNSPPKQARVLKRLAELDSGQRQAIATAAVAFVGGRDDIQPSEVKFLERLHKSLGLPQERVYSQLHRTSPKSDEPVAISVESRQSGIPIPVETPAPAPGSVARVRIDAERLARTQRETAAVSELLANIFEEEPQSEESPVVPAQDTAFEGLDPAHTELVELLELKGSVAKVEFDERARAMKLLPEGAIERINDWSFDLFDEPLLEDGDKVVMAPHLRGRLAELRETA
ncbi:MAG: TerB N-terminal domain-containing protein [Hyphomicrobium sp.]